ncbi:MAG: GAF domain-containing sensor histidine kinase [Chloroflexi bacterium]|nr:GAF domain-containing sensor histidine kinase [Chloroflexota bacterium]
MPLPDVFTRHLWLQRLAEWLVLFLVLIGVIWAATQSQQAPQLVLLGLLTVIALNFSLPVERGSAGLVPVVVMSSLLMVGLETAVTLLIISVILAEIARPLWNPLWEYVDVARPSWTQRFGVGLVHLISLVVAGLAFARLGGVVPLTLEFVEELDLNRLTLLALAYGATYLGLTWLLWLLLKRPWARFFQDHALTIVTFGFLAQPFAWLGSITFVRDGLPTFVIFAIGVSVFSVLVWLSWQRRFIMERRLAQFAALNQSGASLRETLDLPDVLARTYALVCELTPVDDFAIVLRDEAGRWQRPFASQPAHQPAEPYQPDDFTRWVLDNGRVLDLDQRNMSFAARHQLTPPRPTPVAWLGIPLTSANQVNGMMMLQRLPPSPTFNQWNRELLLTIAGQASAAIQNARLYSETLRLYNLTDEALAQRVKQLQALLDSIQEGVLMIDTTGAIVLINLIAAGLLNRPAHFLYRQQLEAATDAAPLGFTAGELADLVRRIRSGDLPDARWTIFDSADQRFFTRQEAPVVAADGLALGWLMLFRDVTEEQKLAERRTDLTRMIVHDLRNPLTTVVSTINLLETQPVHEQRTLLDTARHGCLDMLDMVDSLMDINRLEAGQPVAEVEAMRLPPLVEQVVRRVTPLAQQRGIRLTFDPPPPDLPAVWADEELLRRVLINLLDNALKFTPAGGQVNGRLQAEVSADGVAEPGVRCLIADTGPGIPADFHQRVFDRFTRTNQDGAPVRGTGLGLTFCKLAIEAQNGRIWVEDAPGGGSLFVFTLPGIPDFNL